MYAHLYTVYAFMRNTVHAVLTPLRQNIRIYNSVVTVDLLYLLFACFYVWLIKLERTQNWEHHAALDNTQSRR